MTQVLSSSPSGAFPGTDAGGAPIPYATPLPPRVGPRAWAGAAILVAALVLVGLGGCFLIGVLAIVQPNGFGGPSITPRPLSGPQFGLMIVLYLLAFASFGGSVALFVAGTRGLLRVMRGR